MAKVEVEVEAEQREEGEGSSSSETPSLALKRKAQEGSSSPSSQNETMSSTPLIRTTTGETPTDLRSCSLEIFKRIHSVFRKPTNTYPPVLDLIVDEIYHQHVERQNGRVVLYGVGREGFMLNSLWWRLHDYKINAHFVSDCAGLEIGKDDLLIASAGSGVYLTVEVVCSIAKSNGARVLLLTAEPKIGSCVEHATMIGYLPAPEATPGKKICYGSNFYFETRKLLPMRCEFELALMVLFEMVAYDLRDAIDDPTKWIQLRRCNLRVESS